MTADELDLLLPFARLALLRALLLLPLLALAGLALGQAAPKREARAETRMTISVTVAETCLAEPRANLALPGRSPAADPVWERCGPLGAPLLFLRR